MEDDAEDYDTKIISMNIISDRSSLIIKLDNVVLT